MNSLTPLTLAEFKESIEPQVSLNALAGASFKDRLIDFDLVMTKEIWASGHNGYVRALAFGNCTFSGNVELGGYSAAGTVTFENCRFSKYVSVGGNCTFKGRTVVDSGYIGMGAHTEIEEFTIHGTLRIESNQKALNIKKINLDGADRQGILQIEGSIYGIVLEDVKLDFCELRQGKQTEVTLNRVDMNSVWVGAMIGDRPVLRIWSSTLDQFFSVEKQLPGSRLEIELLLGRRRSHIGMFKYELASFDRFSCRACDFGTLEFYGENRDGNAIDISDVKLKNLIFRDMRNKGLMSFSSITMEPQGKLTMRLATLGKTDFILCNFTAGNFEFENSKITDAFMAESDFAKRIVVNGSELHSQEQLAFGQIATAFQKQGDTVRYLEYQSREIEAHYKGLRWFPAGARSLSFTKFSLWLNKISNDFGRNWMRAILFSFGIGIVFFYFLVISSSEYYFDWGFRYDDRLVGSFLKFMNPLRFFDTESLFKVGNGKPFLTLCGWSNMIDFFSRVLVAYGFYQMIQAFRRYGRSR